MNIIRLLLEAGFLWGSGDLVCKVVDERNGYHKTIRDAFARTILHDLVRNNVHLNDDQLALLRCGGFSSTMQQKEGFCYVLLGSWSNFFRYILAHVIFFDLFCKLEKNL